LRQSNSHAARLFGHKRRELVYALEFGPSNDAHHITLPLAMASASKKYNVILMEAAEAAEDDDCEDLPKDTNLRELKIYLSARGVNIGQNVDWMGKFNSCRKIIRVENKRPVGERTSSEESGRSKESGYFSDPFRVKVRG
jgi:hypothetical protein